MKSGICLCCCHLFIWTRKLKISFKTTHFIYLFHIRNIFNNAVYIVLVEINNVYTIVGQPLKFKWHLTITWALSVHFLFPCSCGWTHSTLMHVLNNWHFPPVTMDVVIFSISLYFCADPWSAHTRPQPV